MFQRLAWGAFLPLSVGAFTYLFLRPKPAAFVVMLTRFNPLESVLTRARSITVRWGKALPEAWLAVLPDVTWAFAVGATLAIFWRGKESNVRFFWWTLGAFLTVGYELGQALHWVSGTFDPRDLVAQGLGYALGFVVFPSSESLTGSAPNRERIEAHHG
ncbi:MAG: hypothetical protein IPK82_43605 [Polyangiaceae bacterium]|nr:hypothetical protein [Polyangiaceae bacterium]